jgi:hypothetical protein
MKEWIFGKCIVTTRNNNTKEAGYPVNTVGTLIKDLILPCTRENYSVKVARKRQAPKRGVKRVDFGGSNRA